MSGGPATPRPLTAPLFAAGLQLWSDLQERFWPGATALKGYDCGLPSLLPGDPDQARALYRGRFHFAGQEIVCQPSAVFDIASPHRTWAVHMRSFAWLADLKAANLGLYRAYGRHLFLAAQSKAATHDLETVCERLLNLCRHGGFLLQGAPSDFEAALLSAVNSDVKRLVQAKVRSSWEALMQSAAVLAAALSYSSPQALRLEALARTSAAAAAFVLPDGGPADRRPRSLVRLLAVLLPLRDQIAAQHLELPQPLNAALERALPMLRLLCVGDGGLATFQGVDGSCGAMVRAILAADQTGGRAADFAPHTGFARLQQGGTIAVADCGGPSGFDSPLAFEFSDGAQRVVTSCGVPPNAPPAWVDAARSPAAHSTLDIAGDPSVRLSRFFRRKKPGTQQLVMAEHLSTPHGILFKGKSSRYAGSYGIFHVREIFLAVNGHDLRGEDRFERDGDVERGWPEQDFALRFHLHPSVQAQQDAAGKGFSLTLADGAQWHFSARGGQVSLEDSLFVATGGAPKPCKQLVIRGAVGRPDIINWAFRKP